MKHGAWKTPEYTIWRGIITRCENQRAKDFPRYGGRGIRMCPAWRYDFSAFLADMGPRPPGVLPSGRALYTVERRDGLRGYEPGNCRWATHAEQQRNTSYNVNLTFNGKTQCIAEWAREVGLSWACLSGRIVAKWSVERALTEPVGQEAGGWKVKRANG